MGPLFRMRVGGPGLALALVLVVSMPGAAHAAACCISATVSGVGRLLIWEQFAAGVQVGYAQGFGQWDTTGRWRAFDASYAEGEARADLWGLLRLSERAQVSARLPGLITLRRSGDTSGAGGGLGDSQLGLRYELVSIGQFLEIPAIALTASVIAPTGVRPESASPFPLGTGATGRGAWVAALALAVEQTFLPWYVRLDVAGTAALPFRREDLGADQTYGPGVQAALSVGRSMAADTITVGASLQFDWEGALRIGQSTLEGSGGYSLGLSGAVSWRFDPHWTVQAAVANGLYPSGFGANRMGRLSATAGVRYGFF